jgi:hypothetical protein
MRRLVILTVVLVVVLAGCGGDAKPTETVTPGSCCAPDGSCTVTAASQCPGGTWTVGLTCAPNACTKPAGACCHPDGSCTVTLAADCAGPWTMFGTCAPDDCAQPAGSCCYPEGSCAVMLQSACTGVWTMFGVCDPNACQQPAGSCCAPAGTCTVTTEATCSGTWELTGACTPNPCVLPPPTGLAVVNGSDHVILRWRASLGAYTSDFKGYNIYRHTSTMVGATDAQLLTYKKNSTVITTTTYTDGTALNGTKYYYAVRALRGSSELSTPTSEYDTAPRREGNDPIDLAEFMYTGQPAGLNCATPQAYAMESSGSDNRLLIDCYLGTMGTNDESTQNLALKSPHLVLNHSTNWAGRVAELVLLGTGQAAWDIPNAPTAGWASQVELGANPVDKVIAVRTPGGAGVRHYAKVWIQEVNGAAGQRVINAMVAYQEIADYPRFVCR